MSRVGTGVAWEQFAAEIAAIADVPANALGPHTRIIEDLACDSLALTELVVALIHDYEMEGLSEGLGDRSWIGVTLGEVFDEFCSGENGNQRYRFELSPERQA